MKVWSALLLFLLMGSCTSDFTDVEDLMDRVMPGKEVAREIVMLYSDSAIVRVRVVSPLLIRHTDESQPRDEFPNGLHVDFLDAKGIVHSTLDADKGERLSSERKVVVRSDKDSGELVVLRNIKGEKLETSELIWDELRGIVSTEKFVKITKPDEIILAYGFESKQDFSEYTLQRVVARVKVENLQSDFQN